ncbi:putative repeat protein (TIGR03943 family) [Microbacterium phyllosphaerae]|uniref:Repeat protein (TIGR03943 family) n=1 Tax=Microbacterium phyllosphaerae TaxID=124798 RepID=A0ABS4WMS2_9MICO|nr:TIGR03943 family protein [Microbacterium phyllosphaerae]MBP2376824.1 putative repeat protein (TIGR03943 family) [Microbacterium phyllosphaerae]
MSDHTHPHTDHAPSRARALGSRWLGIGLATVISVVTLGLGLTGRLNLYISPESVWFACAAAVVTLVGAIWSCTLPLGDEGDHGHDHGHDHGDVSETDAAPRSPRRALAVASTVTGGVIASGVVVAALVLPPASLSVELAMSRVGEQTALFAGADDVTLGVADTSTFGVGDWASVFATATNTAAYDGKTVTLTGFVTPTDADEVNLTRLVITHCVIDAQPATLPVTIDAGEFDTGQWVEVEGTIKADADGSLHVEPNSVTPIDEPQDPYEY